MHAKLAALLCTLTLVACGRSGYGADTQVAPMQPRMSAFLEGKHADAVPEGVHREALRDDVELISAKDRSLCFRTTLRQGQGDDVSISQWEVEVNDQPVVLGKEVLGIRDYSPTGEVIRAEGVAGDQVAHVRMPALAAKSFRVFERQVAFCRGFNDGIPEEVEVEITLKRSGSRDFDESFKFMLRPTHQD